MLKIPRDSAAIRIRKQHSEISLLHATILLIARLQRQCSESWLLLGTKANNTYHDFSVAFFHSINSMPHLSSISHGRLIPLINRDGVLF